MSKINILVVDDESEIRELIEEMLLDILKGEVGILFAEDGVIALNKLRNQKFNLLISDIKMPRLDGTGLFKSVFSGVEKTFPPDNILVLSSEIPESKNNRTVGRVSYMVKPFNRESLSVYLSTIFPGRVKNSSAAS